MRTPTLPQSLITRERLAILGVLGLAAALNLVNLEQNGLGNTYYAAAVRSMLQGPHTFFFASFDPGGFVSVDKPPLGLWIQTASAAIFGFSGPSLILPQAIAGIASVGLVYAIARRAFDLWIATLAAAMLALSSISVVVARDNILDAQLVAFLLGAAWLVVLAAERAHLRFLVLGGVCAGLAFNAKMLEAAPALPALILVYFLAAPTGLRTRVAHVAIFSAVVTGISLAWLVAVDLTPAHDRPYVGSTQTNSALELAFGYNGIQRLLGANHPTPSASASAQPTSLPDAPLTLRVGYAGIQRLVGASQPNESPPAESQPSPTLEPAPTSGAAGTVPKNDPGTPGPFRLFKPKLGGQIGWLLPPALIALAWDVGRAVRRRRRARRWLRPGSNEAAAILWGTWLVVGGLVLSFAHFLNPTTSFSSRRRSAPLRLRGWFGWSAPIALATAPVGSYQSWWSRPARSRR